MSDFQDFLHSRILRHPTTWIVAAVGGAYGGYDMYLALEAKRAANADVSAAWRWSQHSFDFAMGATMQIVFLMCAVWMVAGLLENANAWIRQLTVFGIYLGINWLGQYL